MLELTKSSIKCWQKYNYNGKIEVGSNSAQVPIYLMSLDSGSLALDLKVNNSLVRSVGHCACVQRTSANLQQNCLSEIKTMQTDYFRLANLDTLY